MVGGGLVGLQISNVWRDLYGLCYGADVIIKKFKYGGIWYVRVAIIKWGGVIEINIKSMMGGLMDCNGCNGDGDVGWETASSSRLGGREVVLKLSKSYYCPTTPIQLYIIFYIITCYTYI